MKTSRDGYTRLYAGTNEVYRYGHKAVERVEAFLNANDKGYFSFPTNGGNYWKIGTSDGKYGEFCKIGETIFSVNKGGYLYAKAGTEKGEAFVKALNSLIAEMKSLNAARFSEIEEDED